MDTTDDLFKESDSEYDFNSGLWLGVLVGAVASAFVIFLISLSLI